MAIGRGTRIKAILIIDINLATDAAVVVKITDGATILRGITVMGLVFEKYIIFNGWISYIRN